MIQGIVYSIYQASYAGCSVNLLLKYYIHYAIA